MTTKKKDEEQGISRRETLRLLGAAGATTLVGLGDEQLLGLLPFGQPGSVVQAQTAPGLLQQVLFAPTTLPIVKDLSQVTCVVKPALTEGPYFKDEKLNRSDIRSDPATGTVKAGVPLRVKFNVYRSSGSTCTPLVGAEVDM